MGGIFNTRTATAVVTEALAAGVAVVVEPWRSGHDVTLLDMSDFVTSLAYPRDHRADAEWCENGREGDVWVRPTSAHLWV